MKPDSPILKTPPVFSNLGAALAVVMIVIAGEYFFRHYVVFWMPKIGTLLVNDMLSLFLAYSLLLAGVGWVVKTNWRQELAGIWQAVQESARSWNSTLLFVLLVLSIVILPFFDRLLWGRFTLPMVVSPYRNPNIWLGNLAPLLKPLSLILVNGVFVPIAEDSTFGAGSSRPGCCASCRPRWQSGSRRSCFRSSTCWWMPPGAGS